jgi:cysteine-rich repeat protein
VAAGGADGGTGVAGGSPPCGNGTLDAAEQCDDGNSTPSDGCSGGCTLEGAGDECPTGVEIELGPAGIWITDTTAGKATDNDTTCGGNSAGDTAFLIRPAQSGDVTVSLTGDFDKVLAIRDACTDSDGWYCDTGTGELSDSFAVTASEPFHVIVSGMGGDEGAFNLHLAYP